MPLKGEKRTLDRGMNEFQKKVILMGVRGETEYIGRSEANATLYRKGGRLSKSLGIGGGSDELTASEEDVWT